MGIGLLISLGLGIFSTIYGCVRISDLSTRIEKLENMDKTENKSTSTTSKSSSGEKTTSKKTDSADSVAIKSSPDKYTWYVKNYVGKNLASFGYTSLGGDRRDKYGEGTIKFVINTEDGSYVDIHDESSLKEYVVTEQSVAPNTEIKYVFMKNSSGEEYSNLVDSQNVEEIELKVKKNK